MKIAADECVAWEIVARLRQDGHDVVYVAEISPGIEDEEVLILAAQDDILLLTADKDFGELAFRQGMIRRGILLYRLSELSNLEKASLIAKVIAEHGDELLKFFSVLTEKSLRIRMI